MLKIKYQKDVALHLGTLAPFTDVLKQTHELASKGYLFADTPVLAGIC
jgi:hypothetical protein